jgi:prepilin-type N-terminal cleavage/methylation domain-containing protein
LERSAARRRLAGAAFRFACTLRPHPPPAGFTLIEVILVVGLLAIVAAMAWPTFREMFEGARLSDAASELRTTLREARRRAVADGLAYRCDYLPDAGLVRIVPASDPFDVESDELDADPLAAPARSPSAPGDASTPDEDSDDFEPHRAQWELPQGVRILRREEFEADSYFADEPEDRPPTAAGGGGPADRPEWTPLCELHPDGSASAARIRMADGRGVVVEILVDPLTGAVEVGEPAPPPRRDLGSPDRVGRGGLP